MKHHITLDKNYIGITGCRGELGSFLSNFFSERTVSVDLNRKHRAELTLQKLVHTVAKHPTHDPRDILKSNLALLDKLLEITRQTNLLYFISSRAIDLYFGNERNQRLDYKKNNEDLYVLSKVFAEILFEKSNVNGFSLRIPALLELKNKRNFMSLTLEKMSKNEDIFAYDLDQIFNSFISPKDIARFINESTIKKGWYNINLACKPTMTLKEILHLMKESTKSKSKISEIGSTQSLFGMVNISEAVDQFGFRPSNPESCILEWIRAIN